MVLASGMFDAQPPGEMREISIGCGSLDLVFGCCRTLLMTNSPETSHRSRSGEKVALYIDKSHFMLSPTGFILKYASRGTFLIF